MSTHVYPELVMEYNYFYTDIYSKGVQSTKLINDF